MRTRSRRSARKLWALRQPGRAVCPECGYPIVASRPVNAAGPPKRGATAVAAPRCPECGELYPGPLDTRLRWGRRRIPIERRAPQRAVWPIAWLQTLLLATFRPLRTASRLATADRSRPAVAFAALTLLAAAVLMSTRSTWAVAAVLQVTRVPVDFVTPGRTAYLNLSPAEIVMGWLLCVVSWFIMMALCPLSAAATANIICERRPAAFHAACRWACYATVVLFWSAVALLAFGDDVYTAVWQAWRTMSGTPAAIRYFGPVGFWRDPLSYWVNGASLESPSALSPRVWPAVVAYGVWFLTGLLASVHRDHKRMKLAHITGFVYAAAWALLAVAAPWWVLSLAVR